MDIYTKTVSMYIGANYLERGINIFLFFYTLLLIASADTVGLFALLFKIYDMVR